MKHLVSILDKLIRIGLFLLAFGLVIIFLIEIDTFVLEQRLYFLRTGNWEDLITITLFGILVAYILKKLLMLQYKWGVRK